MNGVLRSALALFLLSSAVAACTSAEQQAAQPTVTRAAEVPKVPHTPTATATAAAPAVTIAEAGRALNDYLATDDVIRAGGDERMALKLSRDAQLPLMVAHYRDSKKRLPRYTWGPARTLLVPRLKPDAPTRWFAALVERRSATGASRTALLAFVSHKGGPAWQKTFETLLDPRTGPPKMFRDADGYATALDARDQSVLVSPNLFGPLHATVAEEGADGYAARLISPGRWTTDYYSQIVKEKDTAQQVNGLAYNSIFAAAAYPVLALRTEEGGALVLYTLIRTSTWTTPKSGGSGQGIVFAIHRPVEIPKDARWDLPKPGDEFIDNERRIISTLQYAGLVPPKNAQAAQAQVIGQDGFVTSASTS
ncbi:hypothetical protein J5X84_03000 [Streptosporangiaceae bacterium NEAU-GS5]|nr:hypothetical protein [Streptosporangiaceae bacterium NEAU-GS5]